MHTKTKNKNKRPITSTFAFISFAYVVPTGILTHFGEHGLEQFHHMIGATHWTSSLIFLVSTIFHIVLNWKSMKRYMFTEIDILSGFREEFLMVFMAVTLSIVLVATPFLFNQQI